MTRPEAALLVRERWERLLGMSPEEAPHVFSSDVDNMLEDLSTGNILDVADRATGNAPVTDGLQVGDTGVSDGCEQMRALQTEQGQDLTANGGRNQSARSCENTADSRILDRHGDDRFADNIQRALEGLPQNGDAEEEEAAAEEGAAIEASNLPYPEYERNGR